MAKHNHYFKDVRHLQTVDVYRVLSLFAVTDPCIQHAVKKLLVAGGRGAGKDIDRDIQEAIDSLARYQQMRAEDMRVVKHAQACPAEGIGGSNVCTCGVDGTFASELIQEEKKRIELCICGHEHRFHVGFLGGMDGQCAADCNCDKFSKAPQAVAPYKPPPL